VPTTVAVATPDESAVVVRDVEVTANLTAPQVVGADALTDEGERDGRAGLEPGDGNGPEPSR
jgi:hypothetical protein